MLGSLHVKLVAVCTYPLSMIAGMTAEARQVSFFPWGTV